MGDAILRQLASKAVQQVQTQAKKQGLEQDAVESIRIGEGVLDTGSSDVIPLQCLPLEYILGQTGFPLNRIVTVQGPSESSKSSFFWFIARKFLANGGNVFYFDLENKHDAYLSVAYLGNPLAYNERVRVFSCPTVETFSLILSKSLKLYMADKELREKPLLIGIDTLGANTSDRQLKSQNKGQADPGYSPAKAVGILQGNLKNTIGLYLHRLPLSIIGLQQERIKMETHEKYGTGGTFATFCRSVAVSMQKIGTRTILDEEPPTLRMGQLKMSTNTRRRHTLVLPTIVRRNIAGFTEFGFAWHYALLDLLSNMEASLISDVIGKVNKDTQTKFSIPGKNKKNIPKLQKKYACSSTSADVLGPPMLQDFELLEALRDALHIHRCRPYAKLPYSVPDSYFGHMWMGPEECPEGLDWQTMEYPQVCTTFREEVDRIMQEGGLQEAGIPPQTEEEDDE